MSDEKILGLFRELAGELRDTTPLPERLGPYKILDEIASGGAGRVCRALHVELNRLCAIKFIHASPDDRARLRREARIAASLSHPNIVTVHEAALDVDRPYFVMEFVDGPSLEKAKLAPRQALETMRTIALAIQVAHDHGIIHRDVKPANILQAPGGPKIADFGLARLSGGGSTLTGEGIAAGTPRFMSPEAAHGLPPTPLTDVYGLGATLYFLLGGAPPFDGPGVAEVLHAVAQDDPVPLRRRAPTIHRDVEVIVHKAMAREPGRRYASAREFADDIGRYLDGQAIRARPPSMARRAGRILARRKGPAIAALVVVAVLAVAGWREHRASDASKRRDEAARRLTGLLDAASAAVRRAEETQYVEGATILTVREAADRAIAAVDAALAVDPSCAAAHSLKGRAFAISGRREDAVAAYTRALDIEPRLVSARTGRGRIHLAWFEESSLFPRSKKRDLDDLRRRAVEDLRAAAECGGSGCEPLLARAGVAYASRENEDVLRLLARLPDNDPAAVELHLLAARACIALARPLDAIAHADAALRLRPGDYEGFVARAYAEWQARRFDSSIADYLRALKYQPGSSASWNMLGLALYQQGRDYPQAIAAFDQAIALSAAHVEAYSNRSLARTASGDLDGAIRDLTAAIAIAPDWIELYRNRCFIYAKQGRHDLALADADEMVRRFPGHVLGWSTRGQHRCRAKDMTGARSDLAEALRLDPAFDDALLLQGQIEFADGRYDDAARTATRILEHTPTNAQAYGLRGLSRASQGRLDEAKPDLRRAADLDPTLAAAFKPLLDR